MPVTPGTYVTTLRLTEEQHQALVMIAKLDGTSVTGQIRLAVDAYIERRRRGLAFQERLQRYRAEQDATFRRLAASVHREEVGCCPHCGEWGPGEGYCYCDGALDARRNRP